MKLGREQHRILEIIWDAPGLTAKEITDRVNLQKPTAHSTVQTILRQLIQKGAVKSEAVGRTFVFTAEIQREEATKSALQEVLDRMFDGSASLLVANLIDRNEVSSKEIAEIKEMIRRYEEDAK